jgi:tRNA threonylcarbamoyladenosine biosynthesis protein TsaB
MRALALDTTTRDGSVALVDEASIVDERRGDGSRTHAERLPGDLVGLLTAHRLAVADVDLLAVAAGPGSFTGLRVGIATIQGVAFASRRPVVAVSALDALAQLASAAAGPADLAAAWIDAYRGEVYSALYRVTPDAGMFEDRRLVEIEGASVGQPSDTLARWAALAGAATVRIAGDGAARYQQTAGSAAGLAVVVVAAGPLAGAIGRTAIHRARAGRTISPSAVQPIYVRRPDAEVARDAKGGR